MDTITVRHASYQGSLCITAAIPAGAFHVPRERGELLAELLASVTAAYDEAMLAVEEEEAHHEALIRLRRVAKPVAA